MTSNACAARNTIATYCRPFLPPRLSLTSLRAAALGCEGCDLYRSATQTVFGEGRRDASIVLVGEQPGDQEDRRGRRPFVGPAGRLLERALRDADIPREVDAARQAPFAPTSARRRVGRPVRLKDYRGKFSVTRLARETFVTIHPSAVLRLEPPERDREYLGLVADLNGLRHLAAP